MHPFSFIAPLGVAPAWAHVARIFAFTASALGLAGVGVAFLDAWALDDGGGFLVQALVNASVALVVTVAATWWVSHLLGHEMACQGVPQARPLGVTLVVLGGLVCLSFLAQILFEGGIDLVLERSEEGEVYSFAQPLLWLAGLTGLGFGIALLWTGRGQRP